MLEVSSQVLASPVHLLSTDAFILSHTVSLAKMEQFMCHNKIDMVVLVDGSGSVTMDQFKIGKKFVADLVKHFDISKEKTNVAMVSYSQYTYTGRTFNDKTSPESVLKAVDKLPYEGAASRFDFGMDRVESEFFNTKSGARTNSKGENHTEHFRIT